MPRVAAIIVLFALIGAGPAQEGPSRAVHRSSLAPGIVEPTHAPGVATAPQPASSPTQAGPPATGPRSTSGAPTTVAAHHPGDGTPPSTTQVSATQRVSLAALQVSLTTSSDWTRLRLSPGRIVAHVVDQIPSGASLTVIGSSIVMQGVGSATIRIVFEETSGAPVAARLEKGWSGSARARVARLGERGSHVATLAADRGSAAQPGAALELDPVLLFGTKAPTLPRADGRPMVLAFYYPWWGPASWDRRPVSGRPPVPYNTWAVEDVLAMTRQARAHGVDGFIVNWSGEEKFGAGFDAALVAAERVGGSVAPYLDVPQAVARSGVPEPAVVRRWIGDLLKRATSGAFLRSDGIPVMFVYQMEQIPAQAWASITEDLEAAGTPIRLVGDSSDPRLLALEWGIHRYNPAFAPAPNLASWYADRRVALRAPALIGAAAPKLLAATVIPGYDDRALRGADRVTSAREGGRTYERSWQLALEGDADWVLITSWNEWYEGTFIQPSLEFGDQALRQTADGSRRIKTRS